MSQTTQTDTRKAADVVRLAQVSQAFNGVCYSTFGETGVWTPGLEKIVGAGPRPLAPAFPDAIAFYRLSLTLDFDYYALRDRASPLLAPAAMAERLRKINELFPANQGYDFTIHYRRRT